MSDAIRVIPIEQAVPGMMLAEDLRQNANGILLPRALILTEKHLASLRQRGVREIGIIATDDSPPQHSTAETQALREAAQLKVQRLFRHAGSDKTMQALYRTVLEYRREKIT